MLGLDRFEICGRTVLGYTVAEPGGCTVEGCRRWTVAFPNHLNFDIIVVRSKNVFYLKIMNVLNEFSNFKIQCFNVTVDQHIFIIKNLLLNIENTNQVYFNKVCKSRYP